MSKITLITGASRGLGRNTAQHIATKGGDLILTYRSNAAEADSLVAEIQAKGRKAVALQLDTGEVSTFANFAARLKAALESEWNRTTFDHLVNNAGHGDSAPLTETSEAQFDALINVHFKGVYFLSQTLYPMIADGGRVVNISSGTTRFAYLGYSAYAAAKGAVEVLTRYMAKEWGSRGIAVNTVAPGAVETDFRGGAVRDNAELNAQVASITALGRVGVPDDIGPMIASLLSADHRWVNAQRIEVSGGQAI